eukprot:TRINITY_DN7796_c0_g3_i2.p2 TRINITY_DN7796_c0_g3~~TRINITY_DN7796_c0_g3_i2.p2  ORF type:complete len:211 (+),score=68.99 TRINITY_DN7796_c0_g3_i2:76-633(+)
MAGSPRDGAHRTAAACSGGVLCGDFGTPDLRRFMVLGALLNTLINFERVSAQLGSVLVDECVGADADVGKHFFTALVERLCFAKRGEKPFLVWMVTGRRLAAGGNEEWMYELERRLPNPHGTWNHKLHQWLHFGDPIGATELRLMDKPFDSAVPTRRRQQSHLREAGVTGVTVVFADTVIQVEPV